VTCDEVRELLPEHLLGTLDGPEDLEVRRHLRGCAGCRKEMAGLSDGVEWFARAALVAIVSALGWGLSQTQRANVSAEDAASYRTVLATLGGKEFRVGTLDPKIAHPFEGSVVLYDSHQGQSWGIVLVRAPGVSGTATVTLSTGGGTDTTIDAGTLQFQPDGDAATWLVTSSDLTPYDHLTITANDGSVLATAEIAPA
jgi:putative zinc finger protein